MLDLKFIRENPDVVKEACRKKQKDINIDELLDLDEKRRKLIKETETLKAQKNKLSQKKNLSVEEKRQAKELKEKIKEREESLKKLEEEIEKFLWKIPNIPFDEVPVGRDENENVVLKRVGKPPKFDFKPKDHVELGKMWDLIDIKRAAKVSGSRFYYFKNEAALLEFALVSYIFETFIPEGFVPVIPPVMIREKPYRGMGRLAPGDEEERYYIPKDELYLIGSAEHTLGPMHMNEILREEELPKRYLGFSSCFRREAGSYGKDVRGIFRVHQFDKVEMFVFASPKQSKNEHEFLLSMEEKLMQALKLPYQVVLICTGDMSFTDAKQYDIETWFPGQNKYRETHSCSNTTDFQARGINCRYRKKDGTLGFVHMLNATACAIGRTIIAILENYQQKDGTIIVPEVLRKYVRGQKRIPWLKRN